MNDDLRFDVEYAYWFNALNERVYRVLDVLLSAVQLVGGSAAAVAAIGGHERVLVWVGMALAIAAALAVLVRPGERAAVHGFFKADAARLRPAPSAEALAAIHAGGPAGLRALDDVAHNAAVSALGLRAEPVKLGLMGRVLQVVA